MASDNSKCIEQQTLRTTHGIMRMFACYETVMVEMKRFCVARFQCFISSSHLQGLVFILGDDNPHDPRTVQWEVSPPSTIIPLSGFILPINFCKCKYIFYMVETNNIKTFQHCISENVSRLKSSGQTSPVSNNLRRTFDGCFYEIAENISLIFILFSK